MIIQVECVCPHHLLGSWGGLPLGDEGRRCSSAFQPRKRAFSTGVYYSKARHGHATGEEEAAIRLWSALELCCLGAEVRETEERDERSRGCWGTGTRGTTRAPIHTATWAHCTLLNGSNNHSNQTRKSREWGRERREHNNTDRDSKCGPSTRPRTLRQKKKNASLLLITFHLLQLCNFFLSFNFWFCRAKW